MLARNARYRAKLKGLPCEIDAAWVLQRLRRGRCSSTGVTLRIGTNRQNPWSPSLDRKVPSLGYTKANTRLICAALNLAKGTASDDHEAGRWVREVAANFLTRR
jgi:hypothetical protein